MAAGFSVMYGLGIISEQSFNRFFNAIDNILKWYYFPYLHYVIGLVLMVFISNIDRIDRIFYLLRERFCGLLELGSNAKLSIHPKMSCKHTPAF